MIMDPVARLHRALVDSLIQSRPNALSQPVTIAEIYQDLVPYRAVRAPLGFAMNADYEHALLRLLAGDQGLARIEPAEAREVLSNELKSPNPDVGLFRDFAACDVFVTIPANVEAPAQDEPVQQELVIPQPAPTAPPASESWEAAVNGGSRLDAVEAVRSFVEPAPPPAPATTPAPTPTSIPSTAEQTSSCRDCGKALPNARNARFCPYCGSDQTKRTCTSCHEELEKDWQYCISCGTHQ